MVSSIYAVMPSLEAFPLFSEQYHFFKNWFQIGHRPRQASLY